MSTTDRTGEAARITVTLAGSEVRAFGEQLLLELASSASTFGNDAPLDWGAWDRDATARLVDQVRELERFDAALVAGEPVEITCDADRLRSLLDEALSAALESLSTAARGGYSATVDHAREFELASDRLSALVSVLDRTGWPEDWSHGNLDPAAVHRIAERLS
jgi:hypothetical protein